MGRLMCFALFVSVVLVGGAAPTATSATAVKAFPPGCWIGKTSYSGTFASGVLNAKVTNGKQTFVLWVGTGATGPERVAVGFVKQTGKGSGTLTVSGSKLTLQVKILGDYELNGSASHVVATGRYTYTGVAIGSGQFGSIPVKLRFPVNGATLTIKTVTPTKVSGLFLRAPWTASRRAGAPAKDPEVCANAA